MVSGNFKFHISQYTFIGRVKQMQIENPLLHGHLRNRSQALTHQFAKDSCLLDKCFVLWEDKKKCSST
eukprot:7532547-Karenia_brevis.AAC.1